MAVNSVFCFVRPLFCSMFGGCSFSNVQRLVFVRWFCSDHWLCSGVPQGCFASARPRSGKRFCFVNGVRLQAWQGPPQVLESAKFLPSTSPATQAWTPILVAGLEPNTVHKTKTFSRLRPSKNKTALLNSRTEPMVRTKPPNKNPPPNV